MTKKLQFIKNKKAVVSAYETVGSMAIIIVIISIFFASVNGIFMPYNSNSHNQLDIGIKATETIIKDTGQNHNFEAAWEDDNNPAETLSVLGLGKSPTLVEYEEKGEGYEITYVSSPYIAEHIETMMLRGEIYSCFLEGTKVQMADNTHKNIEDIQIGDPVKAYDETNKKTTDSKVTHIFHHTPEEMTDYYLIINNYLKVTPNHMLYIDDEWTFAGDIEIGDMLGVKEKAIEIYSIEKIFEKVPTYNFEVENQHNYFVQTSEDSILAHNRAVKRQQYAGKYYYDAENDTWIYEPPEQSPPRMLFATWIVPAYGGDYSYGGIVLTSTTDFKSILQHYEMLGIAPTTYGFLDEDKLEILSSNGITYEQAKEAMGLNPNQNIHITLTDIITDEKILDYGEEISEGEIQTIFSRNVVVFPDTAAKLKMIVSN